MMTQELHNTQTLMERDVLYPTEPETEENVVRGYDVAQPFIEAVAKPTKAELERAEQVETNFLLNREQYEQMLKFKVRTELLAQSYASATIDIQRIASILKKQMNEEMDQNYASAWHIEETLIPDAMTRFLPDESGNPAIYSRKDIPLLEVRVDIHKALADSIIVELPQSDDEYFALAEKYIAKQRGSAHKEAISILEQQKKAGTIRAEVADPKIAALKSMVMQLASQGRIPTEDKEAELIEQLTEEARALAA